MWAPRICAREVMSSTYNIRCSLASVQSSMHTQPHHRPFECIRRPRSSDIGQYKSKEVNFPFAVSPLLQFMSLIIFSNTRQMVLHSPWNCRSHPLFSENEWPLCFVCWPMATLNGHHTCDGINRFWRNNRIDNYFQITANKSIDDPAFTTDTIDEMSPGAVCVRSRLQTVERKRSLCAHQFNQHFLNRSKFNLR